MIGCRPRASGNKILFYENFPLQDGLGHATLHREYQEPQWHLCNLSRHRLSLSLLPCTPSCTGNAGLVIERLFVPKLQVWSAWKLQRRSRSLGGKTHTCSLGGQSHTWLPRGQTNTRIMHHRFICQLQLSCLLYITKQYK